MGDKTHIAQLKRLSNYNLDLEIERAELVVRQTEAKCLETQNLETVAAERLWAVAEQREVAFRNFMEATQRVETLMETGLQNQEIISAQFVVRQTSAEYREAQGNEMVAAKEYREAAEQRGLAFQQYLVAKRRVEHLQSFRSRGVKRDRLAGAQLRSLFASLVF